MIQFMFYSEIFNTLTFTGIVMRIYIAHTPLRPNGIIRFNCKETHIFDWREKGGNGLNQLIRNTKILSERFVIIRKLVSHNQLLLSRDIHPHKMPYICGLEPNLIYANFQMGHLCFMTSELM